MKHNGIFSSRYARVLSLDPSLWVRGFVTLWHFGVGLEDVRQFSHQIGNCFLMGMGVCGGVGRGRGITRSTSS